MFRDLNSTAESLPQLERRAWLAGDHLTAELAAELEEAREEIGRLEDADNMECREAEKRAEDAEEERDKLKRDVSDALDTLRRIIEGAKRMSDRTDILKALDDAQKLVD